MTRMTVMEVGFKLDHNTGNIIATLIDNPLHPISNRRQEIVVLPGAFYRILPHIDRRSIAGRTDITVNEAADLGFVVPNSPNTVTYRRCTVNHVIDPDDAHLFSAILATSDIAILYDHTLPGRVEIARVKPTQDPDIYVCDDVTIAFEWGGSLAAFADVIRQMSVFDYMAYVFYTSRDVPPVMPFLSVVSA